MHMDAGINKGIKMNKKTITLTSFLAVSFSMTFSMSSHAEIYKWKDASGQVHYTATPPPTHKKIKAENIEDKIKNSAGKYKPTSKSVESKSTDEKSEKTNDDDASDKKEANKPTKQLIDYCNEQRKSLKLLKNNQNVTWEQFGKKTNLTASQRKSKIKSIKSNITEECKGI